MNVTVYLGSRHGADPAYIELTRDLGRWIGRHHTLIYGGGQTGLMGELADAALDQGGTVIGVIPRFLAAREIIHESLAEIYTTATMSERKQKMIDLGDAFIAMPGGPGTLEEIAEIISLKRLHRIDGPCILFNYNGYYNPLKELLYHMVNQDFTTKEDTDIIQFVDSIDEIKKMIGPCK